MDTVSFKNSPQLFSPGASPSAFRAGPDVPPAPAFAFLVAPLLGWIADHYGMAATFQSLAALSIVGAIFAYLLKPVTVKKGK